MDRSRLDRKSIDSIKIIILGPIACGKTSIVRRYSQGYFQASYKSTIGADFCRKVVELPKTHTKVELALWDLAGNERFGAMTDIYYRHAVAAIIVFDLARPETINKAMKWYDNFINRFSEEDEIPHIIFFANKVDKNEENDFEELKKHCGDRVVSYVMTSAKENVGIEEGMNLLLERIEVSMGPSTLATEKGTRLVISRDEADCCT